MLIIGIAPGISGAICFFENGEVKNIIDMPCMAEGKKNKRQINGYQLFNEIGAGKVISDFYSQFEKIDQPSREILEPIINELIKSHDTNFKGVGQPLRIALTGSKFGPGIYDIILSLG